MTKKFKKKYDHKEQSNKVISEWEKVVYPFPILKTNPIYSKCVKPSKTKEELKIICKDCLNKEFFNVDCEQCKTDLKEVDKSIKELKRGLKE